MMVGSSEDLRLSLSLSSTESSTTSRGHSLHGLQLNLMPSNSAAHPAASPFSLALHHHHKSTSAAWTTQPFTTTDSSSDRNAEIFRGDTRSFLRGIDVNRTPSTIDCEEEAGVSSPNSTVSSISGKRSERDNTTCSLEENEIERASSRGISDEEDGDPSRKKLRLSKDQSAILEESFKENNTLNPKQKLALAKQLNLRPRQVEVWFQNRRARTKLKQTEVDCEFLKRCCENLTEENRRLQKEVQELRALKMSPQFYMQMTPPTTLTMCPSCERVSAAGTGAVASAAADARHHHHHQIAMGPHDVQHTQQRHNQMVNPWAQQNAIIHRRALDAASAPR